MSKPGNRRHITIKEKLDALQRPGTDTDRLRQTKISPRTLRRARKAMKETGIPGKLPHKRGGPPKALTEVDLWFLELLIQQTPTMSLVELKRRLEEESGVRVTPECISKSLRRRKFALKLPVQAPGDIESNERERADFKRLISTYRPEQLVFMGPSFGNLISARGRREWTPIKGRVRQQDFFLDDMKLVMEFVLSCDGIKYFDVGGGGDELMLELTSERMITGKSVLVFDNVWFDDQYLYGALQEIIKDLEAEGWEVIFLPPNSPDLNPVEDALFHMKSSLLQDPDWVQFISGGEKLDEVDFDERWWELLRAKSESVTPAQVRAWFKKCGYSVVEETVP